LVLSGLIGGVLASIELGRQIGLRRWRRIPEKARIVNSTLEASIFGLMGLLIAFIFYGAGSRFEHRRNLTVQEANAIGTAYLRLDLLPAQPQLQLREDFRSYVRSRLAVYQKIPDVEAVDAALTLSSALQHKVWKAAVEALKAGGPAEKSLVLGALNEMIDITAVRTLALTTHPPFAVFAMLVLTVVMSAGLSGYTMSASGVRDWVSVIAYALVLGAALYVILDYEYPRIGLIRIDPVDQFLVRTLETMK
jgi:hypothetical protein